MTELDGGQLHRAAGVLLTMAAGDALGAGYEFSGPYPPDMAVLMKGGGAFDWGARGGRTTRKWRWSSPRPR